MQTSGNIQLKDLNKLLTCVLCKGYYIDATTIIECLHSLELSGGSTMFGSPHTPTAFIKFPIYTLTFYGKLVWEGKYNSIGKNFISSASSSTQNKTLVNIRSDQTLQDIVYKVVPNLFKNEMKRRRDFYRQNDPIVERSIPSSSEKEVMKMHASDSSSNLFSIESLHGNTNNGKKDMRRVRSDGHVIFVVLVLLKFITLKKAVAGKVWAFKFKRKRHDVLKDEYTLVDLAYIYAWKRTSPKKVPNCLRKHSHFRKLRWHQLCLPHQDVPFLMPHLLLLSAAAPSSRHPSPPPSPQTAQEPNYFFR
ncbi:polycomb complex protein BMI-1-B [Caerostris extrusa]|uniref:Polycomb complex protein BMI-1-B n=1 Tax=Caerostris extrusa TaxID=172846 RepID=A0AAV4NQS0_CAEEX|nr:polycomb complex protein BMI-1-B [Caerostris extrusa]